MIDVSPAITFSDRGTILTIEVAPGSRNASFPRGYNAWRRAVGCTVRSPAEKGKANREVIGMVAGFFGIPKDRISIVSGTTSSIKRVLLAGMRTDAVLHALSPVFREENNIQS
jgi:uncharacterized protein (TIGR00251 family)